MRNLKLEFLPDKSQQIGLVLSHFFFENTGQKTSAGRQQQPVRSWHLRTAFFQVMQEDAIV